MALLSTKEEECCVVANNSCAPGYGQYTRYGSQPINVFIGGGTLASWGGGMGQGQDITCRRQQSMEFEQAATHTSYVKNCAPSQEVHCTTTNSVAYCPPTQDSCGNSLACRLIWDLICYTFVSNGFWLLTLTVNFWFFLGIIFCLFRQLWAVWMLFIVWSSRRDSNTHRHLTSYGNYRRYFIFASTFMAIGFITLGIILLFKRKGCMNDRKMDIWIGIVMLVDALLCLICGWSVRFTVDYFLDKVNAQHGGVAYCHTV
jgi:hypothetical protein